MDKRKGERTLVNRLIENFLNYNYKPFTKKHAVENILLSLFFSLWVCVVEVNRMQWFIIMFALNLLFMAMTIFLCGRYLNERITRYVCDGSTLLILSIAWVLTGYRLLVFDKGENFLLLFVLFLLLICGDFLIIVLTLRNIKLNKYAKKQKSTAFVWIPTLGGMIGIGVARMLFKDLEMQDVFFLVAVLFVLLSFVGCYGCVLCLKAALLSEPFNQKLCKKLKINSVGQAGDQSGDGAVIE